jgi:hypothetical protein
MAGADYRLPASRPAASFEALERRLKRKPKRKSGN